MITRFIQDHFLGGVLLLALIAAILGIVGIYVVLFILAIQRIAGPLLGFIGVGYG
jgi:hypothetical protein